MVNSKTEVDAPAALTSPLLRTTLSLILLQLFSRLFSFSLNQLLLRSTTPQALGVATMGLEVVRDTSLFLLREGIRGAVARTRSSSESATLSMGQSQLVSQTLLLPTLLSPLVVVLFSLYGYFPPSPLPPLFGTTVALYTISAMIELFAERWYLETLQRWETLTSVRVRIEGTAVVMKALGTLATMMWATRVTSGTAERYSLVAFGIGQVVYSSTLLLGFWSTVGRQTTDTWTLRRIERFKVGAEPRNGQYFDSAMKELGWALTKQSFVKQLLTEGDKIVVGRLSKVEDQGGYAVALNYGSLVARILFQPLEESSRLFFSRNLSTPTAASLLSSVTLLSSILLLHTHLSLIFILLVPSYTSPILYHLLGPRWSHPLSSAPVILGAYCTYLPFLAINGITEAFFQSVADHDWLRRGSHWMAVCSIAFVAAIVLGAKMGMGETGLIYANCLNMAMRIAFSSLFIHDYVRTSLETLQVRGAEREAISARLRWSSWAPKVATIGTFAIAGWVVGWSEARGQWRSYSGLGIHVAVGAGMGIMCLAIMYYSERRAIQQLYIAFKSKIA